MASGKVRCRYFSTNETGVPPTPQAKHLQMFLVVETLNDGLESSWKGHKPM